MNGDLINIKGGKKSDVKWTTEQEELLAEWSEKATCYRWLHSRSEKLYRKRNYTFTIPVIILSTLTGTANFAMDSFVPEEHKQIAMAAVGSVNIFAGILSTLQNFLRYAELMEAHRQSEVSWAKFGRNIAIELTLEPKRRKGADDFLKTSRQEYDQLIESSPTIDDPIINQFKKTFKTATLKKPDICNGLDECKIYKPSKEEKLENIVSNAGEKLLKIKTKPNWSKHKPETKSRVFDIKEKPIANDEEDSRPLISKNELDDLSTIGKVSSFKKQLEKTNIEDSIKNDNPEDTPIESIHKVVKILSEKKDDTCKYCETVENRKINNPDDINIEEEKVDEEKVDEEKVDEEKVEEEKVDEEKEEEEKEEEEDHITIEIGDFGK